MAKKTNQTSEGFNEVLLYTTPNGKVKVEIYLQNETIWLSQQKIADLFGVDRTVVTKHLANIYTEGELNKDATCVKIAQVQSEGNREVNRQIEYYNLDAIISVGYRVSSSQATAFRIWATERLKEYIIKGFTMDDERLKNPDNIFGKDYFEEQLARIRDIRSSERRFYQKITDIYAQCSADYSADAEITKTFFVTVQNKLHWAITGQTAAEIVRSRVDSNKDNMGLTTWKNAPSGKIRKTDIGIAKNYLNEKELDGLNRIVSMYLDFAEMQANRGLVMYMKNWVEKLDAFLQFNERAILKDAGKVSHEVALELAEIEFDKFSKKQDTLLESDFDKLTKKLSNQKEKIMLATKNTKAFYNTEIPSDWVVKKLGEISEIKTGDKDTQNKVADGLYPFFVRSDNVERINSFSYDGEAILTSGDGVGVGNNFHYIIGKFDFHQRVYSIRKFNSETFGKFIYYYFSEKFYERVIKLSAKNSVDSVRMEMIFDMKIPLPPLPEQKAIAQVLSTADAAIHTTEKLIAQKELRKKWLMQQLLTGNKKLKGFGGEWKEKKLSDLFDRVTRKNTEGNTTVVTISAQRGFVRQTDFFNKNIASEITDNYFLVERGEFCYNKSYSNGYPWGATKRLNDFDKAVVTTLYICFGVKDEKITNPEFFEQYFGANHLDKGLTKIAHEGGRAHGLLNVTPSDFFSLKVTVPNYEEQTAIAQVLQASDKEISLLKAKADKLREQKKGLMQQLLTGKVRLKIN